MSQLSNGLLLVKVDFSEEKDGDGIYIQEEWQGLPPTGVVTEVAPDVTVCKVGDHVWFERFSAVPHYKDKEVRLCRESAIFQVI